VSWQKGLEKFVHLKLSAGFDPRFNHDCRANGAECQI
jgi:hypothetical protein